MQQVQEEKKSVLLFKFATNPKNNLSIITNGLSQYIKKTCTIDRVGYKSTNTFYESYIRVIQKDYYKALTYGLAYIHQYKNAKLPIRFYYFTISGIKKNISTDLLELANKLISLGQVLTPEDFNNLNFSIKK